MTSFEQGVVAGGDVPGPLRGVPSPDFVADDALVLEVLTALAAAAGPAGVADALLGPLLASGVRAAAIVERDGGRVVVQQCSGYDCDTMAPGSSLPLDAGLPVTEAVRTGRPVAQGDGPGWVAIPFERGLGRSGALLLSLRGAAPRLPEELVRLQRIAGALGGALHRADEHERALEDLARVHAALAPPVPALPGWDLVVRSRPRDSAAGGDVVLSLPDGRDGSWFVVADVCGSGLAAAVVARGVQATFTALAPGATAPDDLLAAADRALRSSVGSGSFVTALAVHASGTHLSLASAGHPAPLLLTAQGARVLPLEPGVPLALDTGSERAARAATAELPVGAALLLYTDGLLDRRGPDGPRAADPVALAGWRSIRDLDRLADEVLAAADEVGAQGDDVTLLLARRLG